MRIAVIIMILGILQVNAKDVYSQNTKLSLNFSETELVKILDSIESQSEFFFLYNEKLLDTERKVTINEKDKLITDILNDLFAGTTVKYSIIDRKIILAPEYLTTPSGQQQLNITGKVIDFATGEGMPGVNIVVKGTTIGVVSGVNGVYSIQIADKNSTLLFSFIGYVAQEIQVGEKLIVNVTLTPELKGLDEVIVIGYGTQSKRVVTGSISSIDMASQINLPVTNVSQAVRGRVAGVQFTDNARPGQGGTILIRGERSITANNAPLIILDGVPFNGSLADINSNDVESMDILKDASAAAIYGSKAANGVILITTKMGKTEKPIIRFNTFFASSSWMKRVKLLSPERYIQKTLDYRLQNGLPADPAQITTYLQASEAANYTNGISLDPWDAVSQTAGANSYDLSVSAKSNSTSFYVSGAIVNEKGLIYNDNSKRISFKTNIETKVTKWLSFGIASQFSNRDLSGLEANLGTAYQTSPYANLFDPDGTPTQYSVKEDQLVTNPLYMTWLTKNEEIYQNLFANLYTIIDVPFIKGLKFRLNFSPNYRWGHNYNFVKQDPRLPNNITTASKYNEENLDWTLENILTYNCVLNENNSFDITLLYGRNRASGISTTANGATFPSDVVTWNNLGQATTQTIASYASTQEGVSSMARLNYRFKSRYLITLTGRRDGASVFAANNKYTFFPSAAFSWIASEEKFLKGLKQLELLKLRLSYGTVGNQAISPYQSLSLTSTTKYVFGDGGSTSTGIYSSNMGNPNLKWETTYSTNIAVDFQLFKSRIGGTVEVYNLDTKDLILSRSLPLMTGYSSVLVNLGQTNNKGIELTLNTVNIRRGDFEWSSGFVFSMNKNKIVHIYNSDINGDGIEDDDLGNRWFIGQPIRVAYDYVFDGIYQVEDVLPTGYKPGWIRVKDLNTDGIFNATYDRKVIGVLQPKFRWSLNNNIVYKNFTLSVFINALQGWIGSYNRLISTTSYVERPANLEDVNWWTEENRSNTRSSLNFKNPLGLSTYLDRSFIRLQDVSLSYDIPKSVLEKIRVQGLRAYISGRNLYTWTKWLGPDPESGQGYYPTSRTVSLGLSLNF
jgi:TonB-linked SusC/RagA family outer membrane protein